MGLQGFVRNMPGSTVEAVVEGEEEELKEFEKRLHSPDRSITSAHIDRIDFEWEEPTGTFQGFRILYFW